MQSSQIRRTLAAAILGTLLANPASAAWDEAVDGELSGDPAAPTPIELSNGSNVISGSVSNGGRDTRDYVTFTLDAGQKLVALNQLAYFDIPGPGGPGIVGFTRSTSGRRASFRTPGRRCRSWPGTI
jgi:hypothetical protein